MENCLIVCSHSLAGVPGQVADIVQDAFTIAVDGGLGHFKKLKLKPDLWIGDGDSVKKAELKKIRCARIKLPRAKDYTDLEYALHVAGKSFLDGKWEGNVVLVGAQGGRFDHELGSMLAVQGWLQDLAGTVGVEHCPGLVSYGEHGMWIATTSEIDFHQPRGKIFSVLAFDRSQKIKISGAKYNVRGATFAHASMGISNEGVGKVVRVQVSYQGGRGVLAPIFVVFPIKNK